MTVTDAIVGRIRAQIRLSLDRTEDNMKGDDRLDHDYQINITDGTGANQASGWYSERITITQASAITFSLGNTDPAGASGDSATTSDPDELKLRAIMIENTDATNYVTVKKGTSGLTNWISGTTDGIQIPKGGMLLATFPSGLDAMTDGTDDEITLQANTSDCICVITYVFG